MTAGLWLAFLLAAAPAAAGLGPLPHITFTFQLPGALTITDGVLLACQFDDCRDARPMEESGWTRFVFTEDSGQALGRQFSPYLQLRLTFSDGRVRESNPFPRPMAINGQVDVIVGDSAVRAATVGPPIWERDRLASFYRPRFLGGVIAVALFLEVLIGMRHMRRRFGWKGMLSVVAANAVTLPFVMCAFPGLPIADPFLVILLCAAFAAPAEAMVIHWMNRPALSFARALALTSLLNAGGFILWSLG